MNNAFLRNKKASQRSPQRTFFGCKRKAFDFVTFSRGHKSMELEGEEKTKLCLLSDICLYTHIHMYVRTYTCDCMSSPYIHIYICTYGYLKGYMPLAFAHTYKSAYIRKYIHIWKHRYVCMYVRECPLPKITQLSLLVLLLILLWQAGHFADISFNISNRISSIIGRQRTLYWNATKCSRHSRRPLRDVCVCVCL